jgi:hypothetical protein
MDVGNWITISLFALTAIGGIATWGFRYLLGRIDVVEKCNAELKMQNGSQQKMIDALWNQFLTNAQQNTEKRRREDANG